MTGILRLSFAHHVDHLDATQDHPGTVSGLKTEHRTHAAFDSAVILLDAVVEILTLPDPDRLEPASWPVLQPALGITRQDGFPVGLAAVDDNPLGPAVPLERLAQEPLGRSQIAPLAEPELNRVAVAVDSPIEIPLMATDLDIGLIDVPLASDGSLAWIEALQQFGWVTDNSSMDGRMVDGDAPLGHHLLQVPQAQIVREIPPHAEQDHGSIIMPALEHRVPHYCDQGLSSWNSKTKSLRRIPLIRSWQYLRPATAVSGRSGTGQAW
jgi:hypothetical protein